MTRPALLRAPTLFMWPPALVMGLLLVVLVVVLFVVPTPALRIQPGEVDDGWTQVGNGTRLQYVDLPDGVRCYRMRYSSNLSCVREPM